MDGADRIEQVPVPHQASLSFHLGGLGVDQSLLFQLSYVLGYGIGTHSCVLTYSTYARPALMRFPGLAENQVSIDRQLAGTQSQGEDLIGQKKIMAQWASLSVSVFDLRDVTSKMFSKILHLCSNLCP